jgi:hypothetical protein
MSKKRWLILELVILAGLLGVIVWRAYFYHAPATSKTSSSPVPAAVTSAVNFPIYYPNPSKLPAGFTLNQSSFKYVPRQGVLYYVNYDSGKKLIFTVQQKPSAGELANFDKQYLAIHRQVLTLVGTATIGAINDQTVVSLPTDSNAWIIMTGPADIYANDDLSQVLKSLQKSK